VDKWILPSNLEKAIFPLKRGDARAFWEVLFKAPKGTRIQIGEKVETPASISGLGFLDFL
jgi:hypothetical protein